MDQMNCSLRPFFITLMNEWTTRMPVGITSSRRPFWNTISLQWIHLIGDAVC